MGWLDFKDFEDRKVAIRNRLSFTLKLLLRGINFIIYLWYLFSIFGVFDILGVFCFFSSFSVIVIYIAILAHTSSIKFFMRATPRFLDSSKSMITIWAKSLGIMGSVIMSTTCFFSKIKKFIHLLLFLFPVNLLFYLWGLENFLGLTLGLFFKYLFLKYLDIEKKILIDQLLSLLELSKQYNYNSIHSLLVFCEVGELVQVVLGFGHLCKSWCFLRVMGKDGWGNYRVG